MDTKKQKPKKRYDRWEQNNYLVDEVCPRLKSATSGLVLMACFRHGRGLGYFRVSVPRIAKSSVTSPRHVQRILKEFESMGLIDVVAGPRGTIPKTYRIRFVYQGEILNIPYTFNSEVKDHAKR